MRWWYLAASAGVLMVVATIVLTAVKPARAPEAPARCAPVHVEAQLGPPQTASFSVRAAPSIELDVDGHRWSPGLRVTAGRHRLRAGAPGLEPFEVTANVEGFSAVLLDARLDGPAVVAVLAGARCESCSPGPALALDAPSEAGPHSLDQSASALAHGDLAAALPQLRRLTLAEARAARAAHQVEAARTLGGAEPLDPALRELRTRMLEAERAPRNDWRVARWNATTERLERVTRTFAAEASGVLNASGERLDALSQDFAHASEVGDDRAQAQVLEAASLVESALAQRLVALHPADCAWVARVQAAFTR